MARQIVRTALALTLVLGAVRASGAGSLDPTFSQRVLDAQNRERAAVGVPPLHWDDGLARDAEGWARHLTRVGTLVHSPDDPADPDPQGENLWAGTRGYYQVEDMVGNK